MFLVLTVHHHHVDHEAHDRQAEDKAEQKRVLPPGTAPEMCQLTEVRQQRNTYKILFWALHLEKWGRLIFVLTASDVLFEWRE